MTGQDKTLETQLFMLDWLDGQSDDEATRAWRLDADGRYWRGWEYADAAEAEFEASLLPLGIRWYNELDDEAALQFIQRVYRRLESTAASS